MDNIPKNQRVYLNDHFPQLDDVNDGDCIEFELPSVISGIYLARIYVDEDGVPFIHRDKNWFDSCREYKIIKK